LAERPSEKQKSTENGSQRDVKVDFKLSSMKTRELVGDLLILIKVMPKLYSPAYFADIDSQNQSREEKKLKKIKKIS
jgi:hypothetical protein